MVDEKELQDKIAQAQQTVDAEQAAERQEREAKDALDTQNLAASHQAQQNALSTYDREQYENLGQILTDVQGKMDAAKVKDAAATKRENAYRTIAGLGDTLSGVANLVGTMAGASNQQQTYNAPAVIQKAEEARKARRIEMKDLEKRLEEMTTRQRDMKAAGTLKEVELKAQHDKEALALSTQQRNAGEAARKYYDTRRDNAVKDVRTQWNADRSFEESKDQWKKTYDLQVERFEMEKDKENYPIVLQDGTYLDIPKRNLNDMNVGDIFAMLPKEVRAEVKGKAYTEKTTDSRGNVTEQTKYGEPSLEQKLAAIVAYTSDPTGTYYNADKASGIRDKVVTLATAQPFKAKNEDGTENIPNW